MGHRKASGTTSEARKASKENAWVPLCMIDEGMIGKEEGEGEKKGSDG